jgi:hypothetical protein
MAANITPIYPLTPSIQWNPAALSTANTALDGTGTVAAVFTAGSNGGRVDTIIIEHLGTNVATVCRLFINNGSSNTTVANNALVLEQTVAANTLSQTASSVNYVIPLGYVLPANYVLNATVGTTIAAGVKVTALGGNY